MHSLCRTAIMVLLTAGLSACTGHNEPKSHTELSLSQSNFPLKQWQMDGSHTTSVKGKLFVGDQPVAGAELQAGDSKRNIQTHEDGSFELLVDRSLLGVTKVHVVSLDKAAVGGQPISREMLEEVKAASNSINVFYPVEIIGVTTSGKDADQVEVSGKMIADNGAAVPYFQVDKYKIGGVVKNAQGDPVQGAVVWIDRDRGEGFAKSTPTDENGQYTLFYLPEEDEATNLSVTYNSVKYTLPSTKVYHLPNETSVQIQITLPQEGTEIDDKPPKLVSRTTPGALYSGILIGLDAGKDVRYTVTIPDAEGRFVLTVPKRVWEQSPAFFETQMSHFVETGTLKPGDPLASNFLQPGAKDPHGIKPRYT